MRFNVEITEVLWRVVTVEVKGSFEGIAGEVEAMEIAENKVREMYDSSEIVLGREDIMKDVNIIAVGDEVPEDFPIDVTVCGHLDTRDTLDSEVCNDCGKEN